MGRAPDVVSVLLCKNRYRDMCFLPISKFEMLTLIFLIKVYDIDFLLALTYIPLVNILCQINEHLTLNIFLPEWHL